MLRVVGAVCCNLALCAWYADLVGASEPGAASPWLFYMMADGLTALAVLRSPIGNMQRVIGSIFLMMCAIHMGYGLSNWYRGYSFEATYDYWQLRHNLAWAMLAILGGWMGYGGGFRNWRLPRFRAPHRQKTVV